MILAIGSDGETRAPRSSGEIGTCPGCATQVRGKRGPIVIHHWAHIQCDCDSWAEPESAWHLQWKLDAQAAQCAIEVPINRADEAHRADAVLPNGQVLEFQHSSLPVEEICRRERFYGPMRWVFDVRAAVRDRRLDLRNRGLGDFRTFRWKHPKKHVAFARRPVYLDVGGGRLFRLLRIYTDSPCGGKGYLVDRNRVFSPAAP